MVSFRLGGGDGVSVEAAKWAAALGVLGWQVRTVAGSGARRRAATRVGDRRARATDPGRGARRPGRSRPGGHREPVLPAPQPAGGGGRGGRLRGPPRAAAPPRPPVAAAASRPPAAAARRPGVGARDDQRAQSCGARRTRRARHDRLQRVRPGPAAGRTRPHPCRSRRETTTPRAVATDAGARPQEHRGGDRARPRPSAAPTGCSARPRTATDPSSTGSWVGRAARSCSACPTAAVPSPTRTPPATPSCCPRPGRASGTRRWSRRPIAARWRWAATRWRPSWLPSASAGSTPTTRLPLARVAAGARRPAAGGEPAGRRRALQPRRSPRAALRGAARGSRTAPVLTVR